MTNESDKGSGTATPLASERHSAAAVRLGPIAKATHEVLADEGGLDDAAVDAVRKQTERLIEQVVSAYDREVAHGEVGHDGSATASSEMPLHMRGGEGDHELGQRVPGATGLLYGRIQSGKTAGMISFVAHALDNGFRTIIVLTSDNLALVDQTAERFTAVQGPRVVSSTTSDRWPDDVPNMKKNLPARGLVVICSKNVSRLSKLRELLESVGAPNHPTLILDDEADQASLDANTHKRKKSPTPSAIDPTKVSEEIQQIRATTPHNVFLQVTATPFAMFLQNVDSPFRPAFTFLLAPGAGYTGGERFFSEDILDLEKDEPASPPLFLIPDDEPQKLRDEPTNLPSGLMRAMVFFLVAASARAVIKPSAYREGQNFLCHESHKVADHKAVASLVRSFLDKFADELSSGSPVANGLLEWAYAELQRTADMIPELDAIRKDIDARLPNREVIVVNAEGDTLKPHARVPNFIIGGNIVGRGLTIPNLLVTYYGRNPQVSQMDTMLQHARMFGYREPLMPFTRVFISPSLAARFQAIHIAERELRHALHDNADGGHVPVQVIGQLRPTRHGVLDPGQVTTIRSGQHLYPIVPGLSMSRENEKAILKILKNAGVRDGWDVRGKAHDVYEVTADAFVELLSCFKVDDWSAAAIAAIIRPLCAEINARLVVRGMLRRPRLITSDPVLATGAISGPELSKARAQPVPTFFVFRQTVELPVFRDRRFLYPSIVFPESMPNHIYNNLDDD
jgi:hypothetical protein